MSDVCREREEYERQRKEQWDKYEDSEHIYKV